MKINQFVKQNWILFTLVVLISFSAIYWTNYTNIKYSSAIGAKIRFGKTMITADDVSYLNPAKNYLNKIGWNDGTRGLQGNYMRSPGYGLFCLPFYALFEEPTALSLIRTIQCLLMALSAGALFLVLLKWTFTTQLAFISAIFFGVLPSFSGYVFYTLTEGITPALLFLLFVLYTLSRQKTNAKDKSYSILIFVFACLIFGFIFITRPVFGTFALILLSIFWKISLPFKKKIHIAVLGLIFSFGPTILWEYRNIKLGKEINGISTFYEIYSPTNNSVWRIPHQSIYELIKLFNISGEEYHQWSKKHEIAAKLDQDWGKIQSPLSIFDQNSISLIGKDTLKKYVRLYQQTIAEAPIYAAQNNYSDKEKLVAQKFAKFTSQYKDKYPFKSWVKTPLKILKTLIWQSHLNLPIFWNTQGKNLWLKLFSLFTSLLNFAIYLIPLIYLLLNPKRIKSYLGLILSVSLNIAYLILIQRGLEQRYYSPLLPIMFACFLWVIYRTVSSFISLFKSRNSSDVGTSNE